MELTFITCLTAKREKILPLSRAVTIIAALEMVCMAPTDWREKPKWAQMGLMNRLKQLVAMPMETAITTKAAPTITQP